MPETTRLHSAKRGGSPARSCFRNEIALRMMFKPERPTARGTFTISFTGATPEARLVGSISPTFCVRGTRRRADEQLAEASPFRRTE